jgi:hypothetical protein
MLVRMVSFDEIAEWAASLRAEVLPVSVRRAGERERASVRAAIAASWDTVAGRRWARVVPPGHERDAGLSVLLDYDDYGFLAHPGHSASVVAGGHEEAHVAAAEVALRLGAACMLSPVGDQGRTFVHAPAAALAAGVRAGFDARTLARAMALAFLAPASPTWGGLVATRAKPARVAGPLATGLRAAAMAADSFVPPARALEQGLAAASFAPLETFLNGLGARWLLPTLSFKPRPASAYAQAALAAFADLGPIEPNEVASVEVEVGAVTLAMEELTRREDPPPDEMVATQFSLERALRVALAHGDLTPETLELPAPDGPAIRLRHEPAFTRDTVGSIARAVPFGRALRDLSVLDWVSVLLGTWRSYGRTLKVSPAAAMALARGGREWRVEELELVFPARVVVRLKSGRELVAERRDYPGHGRRPDAEIDAVLARKAAPQRRAA